MALTLGTGVLAACQQFSLIKQPVTTQSYYCDNEQPLFTVSYNDDTLDLTYFNRTITMATPAGSARQIYQNQQMQWLIKGDGGNLYSMRPSGERGAKITSCRQVQGATQRPVADESAPLVDSIIHNQPQDTGVSNHLQQDSAPPTLPPLMVE